MQFTSIFRHCFKVTRRASGVLVLIGLLMVGVITLAQAAPPAQSPEEGEAIFQQRCASCHSIGGGPLAGPDLQGVTAQRDRDWLIRWISAPDKMLAEGDPIATQLLQEFNNLPMPNMGLSETEVTAVLAYLESETGEEGGEEMAAVEEEEAAPAQPAQAEQAASAEVKEEAAPAQQAQVAEPAPAEVKEAAPPQPAQEPVPAVSPGDPQAGRMLFTGELKLSSGGPACISCHSVDQVGALGGGTLGPDLTNVYTRYGQAGLAPALKGLPFPTMQGVFANKPLTDKEVADLHAYFVQTDQRATNPVSFNFVGIGLGGFILLGLLSHLAWRKRFSGARKPLLGGAK